MENTTSQEYLPQYTLDQLANRVAFRLSYFMSKFRSDTMWEEVLEYCLKVEKNPMNIDSIILTVRNEKEVFVSNSNVDIRKYHTLLTRIFILLYYKFGSDPVYKSHIFPELMKYMGVYAMNKSMDLIYGGITEIHQFEKSYEKTGDNTEEKPEQNDCQNQIGFLKKQIEGLKSDNEKLKKENEQLKKENEQLKSENEILKYENEQNEDEISSDEEISWHDKVRLHLLLALIKNDGANMEIRGNKAKVSKIMKMITGLPLQTCKNYCSDPVLNTTEHLEEITKINIILQAVDMQTRFLLSTNLSTKKY